MLTCLLSLARSHSVAERSRTLIEPRRRTVSLSRRDFLASSTAAAIAATLGRPSLVGAWQGQGFEGFGPFDQANPREVLTCAYEEVSAP